jgi:hypothetical protein
MLNDEQKEYKNLSIKDGPKDGHLTKQGHSTKQRV